MLRHFRVIGVFQGALKKRGVIQMIDLKVLRSLIFLLLWLCWRARLDDRILFDPLLELVTYDVFHEMTTHNVEKSDIE